jgi:hypothetical protein
VCFCVRFLGRPHQSYAEEWNPGGILLYILFQGRMARGDLEPWAPRPGREALNDTGGGGGSVPHAHMLLLDLDRTYSLQLLEEFRSRGHQILSQHGTQHSKSAWLTRVGSLTSTGVMKKKKVQGMFIILVSAPVIGHLGHRSTS